MKVAYLTYPSAFQNVGGGEILLVKLREAVERQRVTVDLFDMWRSKVEDYDVLHVFGSVKDCLGLAKVANARRVPVAITPLLWSDWRRAIFNDGPFKTKADFMARHLAKVFFPAFPSTRRKLLLSADVIFPNSEIERKQIARLFAVPPARMRVVPNGVDPVFQNADPRFFRERYGAAPFVLGVGRIEPRKNQLNLIRAMKKFSGMRLVHIGSPVSGYEAYHAECLREGEGFTNFVPALSHNDPLLRSAYAACELFVLQGWFETPGLVALEAALAGTRLLVTQGGSTREYFKDLVDYLDPADPHKIREAVAKALERPKSDTVKKHVLAHFTWERIATETLGHYLDLKRQHV